MHQDIEDNKHCATLQIQFSAELKKLAEVAAKIEHIKTELETFRWVKHEECIDMALNATLEAQRSLTGILDRQMLNAALDAATEFSKNSNGLGLN